MSRDRHGREKFFVNEKAGAGIEVANVDANNYL